MLKLSMPTISVVINTRNEEENLPRALKSVNALADEIIVVDMESSDKTVDVAKKAGAKVFTHIPTGIVEPARNFAISKATGDWVLILDADEEISTNLVKVLKELVEKNDADYYRIPRKNIIFNKWIEYSNWWPDYLIRFFKKGKVEWSEIIHSVPTTTGKGFDLEAKEENAITHHNYLSIDQYLNRLNIYTTKQAEFIISEKIDFSWNLLITKPVGEFLSRYFSGQGYKDGLHGLILSILQAFSEFIVYLKVWQFLKFEEQNINLRDVVKQMKQVESDIHYWQADVLLEEGGGIVQKIKRKFKLR